MVGFKAPDFAATAVYDQEFKTIKLSDYKGKKYVVLFFYPLDFTFVCPTEITAFSDRHKEFKDINAEILGVSVDSQFSHLAWVQTDRKVRPTINSHACPHCRQPTFDDPLSQPTVPDHSRQFTRIADR